MCACGSKVAIEGMPHITRTREDVPELFQELLRYQARGTVCSQSSPFISIANSSARIVTLRTSSASGQRKRPFARRFAHTHNPLPSHTRAFNRVFVLLVNKNKCPLSGSSPR